MMRRRGFTLIEILAVLLILGLTLSLVLTHGPQRSARLEMDAAARDVVSALRAARGTAIARDRDVTVVIDTAARTVTEDGKPPRALPRELVLTVTSPVTLGGLGAIRFAPDGGSTGGRVDLQAWGRTVTVGVDWLTGRVAIARAD